LTAPFRVVQSLIFIYLFVYLFIYLFVYLFIYLFIYLFVYLFICLLIYLFIYLFIYLQLFIRISWLRMSAAVPFFTFFAFIVDRDNVAFLSVSRCCQ